MKPLGLYLHIPFCRSKCAYCDFYSHPGTEQEMDDYCHALIKALTLRAPQASEHQVETVYFGGGTPSWFGAHRLLQVLNTVRSAYQLTSDCEITVEANPDSVTPEMLNALHEGGVNRLSLGVQSAQDSELRLAGRPHTFLQAQQAVQWARSAGFTNLSLDLIYGLPGQTMSSWQDSVQKIVAMKPEHLSCYGLKVEENTPFWQQRDVLEFPDDDAQADDYLWLCAYLDRCGYDHYEISNFARPGRTSRHNMKYWLMEEYLGFGPAAHSDFGGTRFGYQRMLSDYISGNCPLSEHQVMTPADRLQEYVMLGLRIKQGICRKGFEQYGGKNWAKLEQTLRMLSDHGLVQKTGEAWHCTPRGWLVSNSIITLLEDAADT